MMKPGSLTSFASAEAASDRFEELLRSMGVSIEVGGELERIHLVLTELSDWHSGKATPPRTLDLRTRFRDLVGITHVVDLALATPLATVRAFRQHLDLLNQGKPLQNTPARPNDPSSDKVFELLVGLAAARAGCAVDLDDPYNAKGDNPDVLARDGEDMWGLACKAVSGDAPATLFERIEDGVRQIEVSPATRGIVTLNFKNRFDHDAIFPDLGSGEYWQPLIGTHHDYALVVLAMKRFADDRLLAMANHATAPEIARLFARKKALPGVLVVSQTTAGLKLPKEIAPPGLVGEPAVSRIGFLHLINLESTPLSGPSRFDAVALNFLDRLNEALHV